ncbi:transposable element Tcb1 transposase [Trichonephila clavipes]|nr:transposable element Tcb1 transposase [Trichonephila clavipes]
MGKKKLPWASEEAGPNFDRGPATPEHTRWHHLSMALIELRQSMQFRVFGVKEGPQHIRQSARRPLHRLSLTGSQWRLRCQWCNERRIWAMEWNDIVITDESRFCQQHHDVQIRVLSHRDEGLLNCSVMLPPLVLHPV